MADLTDLQAAQTVKVVGANSSGVETNPVNADSNGNLNTAIYGGTDNTKVGNVTDRLKVDASISSISGGLTLTTSKKLRYDDMNVSNGGVARGTTIISGAAATTVYSYTGSGAFTGFLINLESSSSASDNWKINLIVDGEEIFNSTGMNSQDLISTSVYDFNSAGSREPAVLGIEMVDSVVTFSVSPNFPMAYASSVVIKIQKTVGGNKKFNAGLAMLTKET